MHFIGYQVKEETRGWVVLRKRTGDPEAIHVKFPGSTVRVRYFQSKDFAMVEVRNQLRADQAAATRLGLTVAGENEGVDGAVLTIQ